MENRREAPSPDVELRLWPEPQGALVHWSPDVFHTHLTVAHEFSYETLPSTIELNTPWHLLMAELRERTAHDRQEWSVGLACLDRNGPLRSKPFPAQDYFQRPWGSPLDPLLPTYPVRGNEYQAALPLVPATIQWNGRDWPVRRVGFLHTHPNGLAFSMDDLVSLVRKTTTEKFFAAITEHYDYFALRTEASSFNDIGHYKGDPQVGKPSWKQRLFGHQDTQQWSQAILNFNYTFCQKHQLGLFQGKTGGPLVRLV